MTSNLSKQQHWALLFNFRSQPSIFDLIVDKYSLHFHIINPFSLDVCVVRNVYIYILHATKLFLFYLYSGVLEHGRGADRQWSCLRGHQYFLVKCGMRRNI